jgi:hypothetical protein
MKLVIEIELNNEAFEEGRAQFETARILHRYAQRIEDGREFTQASFMDENGNSVGSARLVRDAADTAAEPGDGRMDAQTYVSASPSVKPTKWYR